MVAEWKTVRLGDVCEFKKGTSIKKSKVIEGSIPVIAGGQQPAYYHNVSNREEKTITISASGAYAGFINYFETPIFASDCTTIQSVDENKILTRYVYLFLKSKQKYIYSLQTGAGQPHVYAKDLVKIEIPLPSLPIQKQIVAILERAESLKQKREQADEEANKIIQSVFYKMFESRNYGEKSGVQKKLGEVCSFVRGPFGGSLKKEIFQTNGYAVYEQQHAIGDNFTDIRYFISEEKFNEMKRFELNSGDLIMSCSGTMGKIAIVPDGIKKGIINQALLKLTPNENLSRVFLKYCLESKSFQNSLKVFSQGAAIQNVASVKILKEIKIPFPPISLQSQFAETVKKIESLKERQKRSTQDINQLFDALMQKAFSGELYA